MRFSQNIFHCSWVPDFSSRSNDTDFGLMSKCSHDLPLQLNKARFFIFDFIASERKSFPEKLTNKIFKNPALLSCTGKCWLHFGTNPKSVSLNLEEKSGTHKQVKTEKITLRKTPNKFDLKNHFFSSTCVIGKN